MSSTSGAGWGNPLNYLPSRQNSSDSQRETASRKSEPSESDFTHLIDSSDPGLSVSISTAEYSLLLERSVECVQLKDKKYEVLARIVEIESNMKLQQETMATQIQKAAQSDAQKDELLNKVQKDFTASTSQIQELTEKVAKQAAKVEEQAAQNLETLKKMHGVTDTNIALEKKLNQLKETECGNKTEISKNTAKIEKLAKKNLKFAEQIQTLMQFNKDLAAEIVQLKNNIQEKDKEIEALESKVFTLKSDVAGLTISLRNEQRAHAATQADLTRSQEALTTAKTEQQQTIDVLNKLQKVGNIGFWEMHRASKRPRITLEFAATIRQHQIVLCTKVIRWTRKNIYMMEENTKKQTKEISDLQNQKTKEIAVLEKSKKMVGSKMPDGDEKSKQLEEIGGQIDRKNKQFDEDIRIKADNIELEKQEIEVYKGLIPRNNINRNPANEDEMTRPAREPSAGKQEVEMTGREAEATESEKIPRSPPPKNKWWDLPCFR